MFGSFPMAGGATAFLVVGLIVLLGCRPRLQGLTIVASWSWLLAAIMAVCGVEIYVGLTDSTAASDQAAWVAPARFAAAVSVFCPVISLMGAKRPQDRAWNLIVLSLWAILALPAGRHLFLNAGTTFEIHAAWSWFLWVLIFVSVSNFLATRYWLCALLLGATQITLLSEHLPLVTHSGDGGHRFLPMLLGASGLLWAVHAARKRPPDRQRLDRLWLDFRDTFGTLWALRVVEQFNATSKQADWGVELSWLGFQRADGSSPFPLTPEIELAVERCLRNVLRRFVSAAWIDQRLQPTMAGGESER